MRSLFLSQCRDLRMGVIRESVGALTIVRARQFWICWRRFIWNLGVTVVKFRVDIRGSDVTGYFRIEVRTDTAELSDMRIAGLTKWWGLIRESTVRCSSKVKPRLRVIERRGVYFRKLLLETDNEKFSLRRVKSNEVSRHPGGNQLQSSLEVENTWVTVVRMEREKSWSKTAKIKICFAAVDISAPMCYKSIIII